MLNPLQRKILDVVGELPETTRFALAGGATLTRRGTVERGTNDLAADVRIREPDTEGSTAIVSLEELAAHKVLALFGRAAARDFQDVAELRRHFSWEQPFALTTEKDAG